MNPIIFYTPMAQYDDSQFKPANYTLDDFISENLTSTLPEPVQQVEPLDPYSFVAGEDNSQRQEELILTELEKDILDNRPRYYLVAKYGEDLVNSATEAIGLASSQYFDDIHRERSVGQILNDSINLAASSAQEGIGNMVAWGAGLIDPALGESVNKTVQEYMDSPFGRGLPGENISEASFNANRARNARLERAERASTAQMQIDIANGMSIEDAQQKKVQRDAITAITDLGNDATAFGNIVAEGTGSLATAIVGGGGISATTKTLAALGKKARRSAVADAFYIPDLLNKAASTGNKTSWFLSNALMEGSGASEQVRNQVLNMSIQDLTENSPEFVKRFEELINKGIDPEEAANQARIEMADMAADYAFNRVAPLAGATAGLTRGLETAGIGQSLASKFLSMAGESAEEGLQGIGQIYQNEAIQKYADQSQDILEGVGRSIGEGVATGAPVAGITQAPSLLVDAVQGTARVTNKVIDNRNKAKEAEKEAQAVLSKNNLIQQAEQLKENTPQFVEQVNQTLQNEAVPEETKENIQEASKYTNIWDLSEQEQEKYKSYKKPTNRWVAVFEFADDLLDHPEHLTDKTAQDFLDLIDPVIDYVKSTTDTNTPTSRLVNSSIGSEEKIAQLFAVRDNAIKELYNNEDIQKVYKQVQSKLENSQQELEQLKGKTITEEDINKAINVATVNPNAITSEVADMILKSEAINSFPPEKQRIFRSLGNIARARQQQINDLKNTKGLSESEKVTENIESGLDPAFRKSGKLSSIQHLADIYYALKNGNVSLAKAKMQDFGTFVDAMNNKVHALNVSYQNGGTRQHYTTVDPNTRSWGQSKAEVFYNNKSQNSIDLARNIAINARYIAQQYNTIAENFPELGLKPKSIEALEGFPELGLQPNQAIVTTQRVASEMENTQKPTKVTSEFPESAVQETTQPTQIETNVVEQPTTTIQNQSVSAETTQQTKENTVKQQESEKQKSSESVETYFTGSDGFNVSTKGNALGKQFSAFNAKLDDGRSIEEHYQVDVKGYSSIKEGKGKPSKNIPNNQLWDAYLNLWRNWASKHPELMAQLRKEVAKHNNHLYDPFARTENNQARALATLLNEGFGLEEKSVETQQAQQQEKPVKQEEPKKENKTVERLKKIKDAVHTSMRNLYFRAFSKGMLHPEKPISRLLGIKNPIANMTQKILKDRSLLERMLEDSPNKDEILAIYDKHPETFNEWSKYIDSLSGSLIKVMNDRIHNHGTNVEAYLKIDKDEETIPSGSNRITMLMQKNTDGTVEYNPELLQGAVLAAIQWLVSNPNTRKDLEDILSKNPNLHPQDAYEEYVLSHGMRKDALINGLAEKIRQYWGVIYKTDKPEGLNDAITKAMASEIIASMQEISSTGSVAGVQPTLIDTVNFTLEIDPKTGKVSKSVNYYITNPWFGNLTDPKQSNKVSEMLRFQNLLDALVLVESEKTSYWNNEKIPVAQRILHSSIKLSSLQGKSIENRQKVAYKFNMPLIKTFQAMGLNNIVSFFGSNINNQNAFNVNDYASKEGSNSEIIRGYTNLVNDLTYAESFGKPVEEVTKHYAYGITSVGRFQQKGSVTPQGNKFTREVIISTESTVDLTDEHTRDNYYRAIAQGFGLKVHKDNIEEIRDYINNILDKPEWKRIEHFFTLAQEEGRQFNAKSINELKELFNKLDIAPSFVAFHNAMDLAKFNTESEAQRKKHHTFVYLEADGATNGYINSIMLSTIGKFTDLWVNMVSKGGVSFGQGKRSLADLRKNFAGARRDVYEHIADAVVKHLTNEFKAVNSKTKPQLTALLTTFSNFNKDVTFNPNVNIETVTDENNNLLSIGRNHDLIKNPVTTINYGSGVSSLAGKITRSLMKSFYAKCSEALARMESDPNLTIAEAFYPNSQNAQEQFDVMINNFNQLLNNTVESGRDNQGNPTKFIQNRGNNSSLVLKTKEDLRNFKFNAIQQDHLINNVKNLYAEPLHHITSTAFGSALNNMMQTNTMNNTLALLHRIYFKKFLADNFDKINKKEGLSEDFKKKFYEATLKFSQRIETSHQVLMADATEFLSYIEDFYGSYNPGDKLPIISGNAVIEMPMIAGVKSIPNLNIGFGDALMMLLLSKYMKTLDVFDGFNISIDQIDNIGLDTNRVVNETWKGNIYKEMYKTAQKAISSTGSIKDLINEVFNGDVADQNNFIRTVYELAPSVQIERTKDGKIFYKQGKNQINISKETLRVKLEEQLENLKNNAIEVDARHLTMQQSGMSVDQMASSENVYLTNDDVFEDTVKVLNDRLEENLKIARDNFEKDLLPIDTDITSVEPKKETVKRAPAKKKESNPSKVRKLSKTAVVKLMREKLSPEQKKIYSQINTSGSFKDFTILSGNLDDLYEYAKQQGENVGEIDGNTKAWISPKTKTIYITDVSDATTLLHEMVHAVTMNSVTDYYMNQGNNLDPQAKAAMERLNGLMQTFINANLSDTEEMISSISDLQNKLVSFIDGSDVGNIKAMNEFLAYTVTTPQYIEFLEGKSSPKDFYKFTNDLANLTDNAKVSVYKTIFKKAFAFLKRLIFGSHRAPQISDKMLSQIQFNAAVLMHKAPSVMDKLQDIVYKAEELGQSRLGMLQEKFNMLVATKLNLEHKNKAETQEAWERMSDSITQQVTEIFPEMTEEQRAVFNNIVQAFMTTSRIHPGSASNMNRIYDYVLKVLKPEDLISNPNEDENVRTKDAQDKYNYLLGIGADEQHRKMIVPIFFALGLTSDVVRNALSKYTMPKVKGSKAEVWLDRVLEDFGDYLMGKLSDYAGGSSKAANIRNALDLMANQIIKNAQERNSLISIPNKKFNEIQARIVDGLHSKSDKANEYLTRIQNDDESFIKRFGVALGQFGTALTGSEKNFQNTLNVFAEWNAHNSYSDIIMHLISDIVGRTEDTAEVYDLHKPILAAVQRLKMAYREKVPQVLKNLFKKTKPTEEQYTELFKGLAKTDIGVFEYADFNRIINYFGDKSKLDTRIKELEDLLKTKVNPTIYERYKYKMEELADYMVDGKPKTNNLLRNAYAIERLLGEKIRPSQEANEDIVKIIDQLTSLYAIRDTKASIKKGIMSLAQQDKDAVAALFGNIVYLRKEEAKKTEGKAKYNAYKGYIPSTAKSGYTLRVVSDSKQREMERKGFKRIGTYQKSTLDPSGSMGYYFCDFANKPMFNEGTMQIINMTANGVDLNSGFSTEMLGGYITDRNSVRAIAKQADQFGTSEYGQKKIANEERLLPVFDENGNVFAYERMLDPAMISKLQKDTDITNMLGVWNGRQLEERMARETNQKLIDALFKQWNRDKGYLTKRKGYVDVFEEAKTNPVLADAVRLINPDLRNMIESKFGEHFMVRRDQLDDVIGVRSASVSDIYTGVSYWSPETLKQMKRFATLIFRTEDNAYEKLIKGERALQYATASARKLIVVKSTVVPMINIASNLLQLKTYGLGIDDFKEIPSIISQIETYLKNQLEIIDLETQLKSAVNDPYKRNMLQAQLDAKQNAQKALTDIYPLIQQGEFSTIADVGLTTDELDLASGRITEYLDKAVNKLPGAVKQVGRYLLITEDTPIYRALNKSVQYGDFVAKVLLYKHLVKNDNLSEKEALGNVKEAFVDYDKYTGRTRQLLENYGLSWFYNYKLRSVKAATYMLRHKPLASLLSLAVPTDLFFGTIGTPLTENVFSKLEDLSQSIGPNMGFRAPEMHPIVNLLN